MQTQVGLHPAVCNSTYVGPVKLQIILLIKVYSTQSLELSDFFL